MVRGANLPPIIAWKVSNTMGSFSFSRSNLSLMCFGLLIFFFQAKAEGHHQQVAITFNVCSWKVSCSGNVHSILVRKHFRSGVNIARARSFPVADIGSDHDLLMMTFRLRLKKNQQAKTHKTQVWPRKAERSHRVGNLPSYDRRKVCTSHHEQRSYRHRLNDHHLQHSSDWNSQLDPWQTSSEEKILDHCRNSWSVRQKERTEKEKIWTWRIWEIKGSEQQQQEVHEKGRRKLDRRTV